VQCSTRVVGEDAPLHFHGAVATRVMFVARREAAHELFAHNLAHFSLQVFLRTRVAPEGGVVVAVDVVDLDSVAAAESIQLAYALGGIGFAVHETHPVEFGVKIVSTKEVLLSTVHVRDAELVDVDREVPRRLRLRDVPSLRTDREAHPPSASNLPELQLAIRGALIEAYESIHAQIGTYAPNATVSALPVKEDIIILVLSRQLEDDFRWAFNYALERPYYELPVANIFLTAQGVCALTLALIMIICLALAVGGSAAPMALAMAMASGSSSMDGIRGGAIGPYQLARVAASSVPTLCLIACLMFTLFIAMYAVFPRLRRQWRRLRDLDVQRLVAAAIAMTVVYYACYASSSLGADALVLKPAAAIQGLQNARSWNYLPTSRMRATYDAEVQHGFRTRCNVVSLCNHDRLDHDALIGLAMVCPELPVDFNLALRLGDTGAFCHAVPDLKFAVPGSVRANTLAPAAWANEPCLRPPSTQARGEKGRIRNPL
jgi:hypothetical protein